MRVNRISEAVINESNHREFGFETECNGFTPLSPSLFHNLKHVTITAKIEHIYDRCFNDCHYLDALILPNTLKTICMGAFFRAKDFVAEFYDADVTITLDEVNKDIIIDAKYLAGCVSRFSMVSSKYSWRINKI